MSTIAENSNAFVAWWKDLDRWVSPRTTLTFRSLPKGWSLVKVGEVVKQLRETCEVKPDRDYRMIGVKWYGKGTFHRETVHGSEISAKKLCPVMPGALIYNRLFAWKASFAVVPRDYTGFFVSSEFPQFAVDSAKLLADFLYLFFTTGKVIRAVVAASVGSAAISRNRFKEEEFLAFPLPLPPLSVQKAIVKQWREAQEFVARSRETVTKLEADIQMVIYDRLSMKPPRTDWAAPKVFALRWKELGRWSLKFNQLTLNSPDPKKGRFSATELGTVIADLENGWSPKCQDRPANQEEWGILKLGSVSFGVFNPSENKALPGRLKPDPKLEIHSGDVLISRANITRLVGACTLVSQTRPKLMLCDKIFRVVFKSKSPILPDYLVEIMKTAHLRHQIENAVTGTSPTMKNITKTSLLGLVLPVPPLEVQQEIVEMVNRLRQRIADERRTAEERQLQVVPEVEEMILGFRPVK